MRSCVCACMCAPVYANKFQNNLTFFFKLHILKHITTDFICYQKLLSATAHSGQIKHWHCHCVLSLSSFEVYTLFNVCSLFEYNFCFFSGWDGVLALCVRDMIWRYAIHLYAALVMRAASLTAFAACDSRERHCGDAAQQWTSWKRWPRI